MEIVSDFRQYYGRSVDISDGEFSSGEAWLLLNGLLTDPRSRYGAKKQGFTRPFSMEENSINNSMDLYIQSNTPKGRAPGRVPRDYIPEKEDENKQHLGIKVDKSIALDYFTKLGYTGLEGL